ncbi:Abi family protein [Roseicella aquatilis]|uniref:Abi family protein n=1 Tax=Roseicella aquatilis TaxID=2527868 RepID=A0A4V2WJS9_9PROT|nr:Abi family protein [Roseicella aquatilis]TCZ55748.1 Abi family protein [Roseicella aquatilis]
MAARIYSRPALSVDDQLARLRARGMLIVDEPLARHTLTVVSYYRFTDYAQPLLDPAASTICYRAGTGFEDVLTIVHFDEALRGLLLPVLERIEIAARTVISNDMSVRHGPHWYLDAAHYSDPVRSGETIARIQADIGHTDPRKRHASVRQYYEDYDQPAMPPSWMVFEALPFGTVANIYRNLNGHTHQYRIAKAFGLPHQLVGSWLFACSYLRNLVAHHGRVWNRVFTIKPHVHTPHKAYMDGRNDRLFGFCVVLQLLNKAISMETGFATQLGALLEAYPALPLEAMAFPDGWAKRPLWQEKLRRPPPPLPAMASLPITP